MCVAPLTRCPCLSASVPQPPRLTPSAGGGGARRGDGTAALCQPGSRAVRAQPAPIVLQDAWSSPQKPARLLWQSGPRVEGLSSGPGRPRRQSQGPRASRKLIPSGMEITFPGTRSPAPLFLAARHQVLVSRNACAHGALTPAFGDPQGGGSLQRNHSENGHSRAP